VKYSDFKGKPVVDVATAEKLGSVSDLYINLQQQRVVGLQVNLPGLFSRDRALLWNDLQSIGENAVTVPSADLVRNVKAVPLVNDLAQTSDIVGDKIMTESGSDIGTAADIEIDAKTGSITSYVLRSGFLEGLQRREQLIPASWVKRIGKKLIVVQDQATSETPQT
jgi:uncharacterized protein YrrD